MRWCDFLTHTRQRAVGNEPQRHTKHQMGQSGFVSTSPVRSNGREGPRCRRGAALTRRCLDKAALDNDGGSDELISPESQNSYWLARLMAPSCSPSAAACGSLRGQRPNWPTVQVRDTPSVCVCVSVHTENSSQLSASVPFPTAALFPV